MHQEATPPLIAIAGVGSKSNLISRLQKTLGWGEELKVLPSLSDLILSKGIKLGDKICVDALWSLENICISFESGNVDSPKIIAATPIDRYALASFSDLKLGNYFDRVAPSFVNDCDVFAYQPLENPQSEIETVLDEHIRCFLTTRKINPQILVGPEDVQLKTLQEAIKLKFVGAVK